VPHVARIVLQHDSGPVLLQVASTRHQWQKGEGSAGLLTTFPTFVIKKASKPLYVALRDSGTFPQTYRSSERHIPLRFHG
jgi:hypothetical protein